MVVWCTQNAPRWQQFLVAPAMPVLVHHFGGYSETRYKKLFGHVESHASAVSLLNSGEQRYIKAISTEKKQFSCMPVFSCMTERKQRVSLDDWKESFPAGLKRNSFPAWLKGNNFPVCLCFPAWLKENKEFPCTTQGNKEFPCTTQRKQRIFPVRLKGNKEFTCTTERKQNIFLHN